MKKNQMISMSVALSTGLVLFGFQNCNRAQFTQVDKFGVQSSSTSTFSIPNDEGSQPVVDPSAPSPVPPPVVVQPPPVVEPPPTIKPPPDFDDCRSAASSGLLKSQVYKITFADPKKSCDWGVDGNLSIKDGYVRARREQYQKISLSSSAKVCNVGLKNTNQNEIVYDDNMIMTLNNYVLASTTDFTKHFEVIDGLPRFSWTNLLDKKAQNVAKDSTPDKQFCLGKDQSLSSCLFPTTEIKGAIQLSFEDQVVQSVLSKTSTTDVEIGLVTTGDNDRSDCQHTELTFDLEVKYLEKAQQ